MTKTIYRKIFLLILFVSIIPAAIGVLQTYLGNLIAMDATIGDYLQEHALRVAAETDRLLDEKINALLDLKTKPRLISAIEAIEEATASRQNKPEAESLSRQRDLSLKLRHALQNTSLQNDSLFVFSLKGEKLATNNEAQTISFSNLSWWNQIAQLGNNEVFISDVTLPLSSGEIKANELRYETKPYVFICTPYYEFRAAEPFPRALLALACSFDEIMEPVSRKVMGGETSQTILYSAEGRLLYPSQRGGLSEKEICQCMAESRKLSGWFGLSTPGGGRQIFAYLQLTALGAKARGRNILHPWYLLQGMDVSNIKVFASLTFWRTSLIIFALVFIFCLLGLYLSRRMVMPLKQLNRSVRRIASGDLSSRVVVKSTDEIGILAGNFNIMTERLAQTYKELDDKLRELDRKAKQITLINDIARAINAELDMEETFKIITTEMKKLVRFDRLSISLLDPQANSAELAYVEPIVRRHLQKGTRLPLKGSNIGKAILTGEIVIKEDIALKQAPLLEEPPLLEEGVRSFIILPLKSKNKIIGTLNLGSNEPKTYGAAEKELLLQISEAVAVAIEHSRLYTRISRFAEELEEKVKERTKELESAQQKLIQTEKFAAVGKLAANVAHEINNPLQIVKNYLQVISRRIEKARHGEFELRNAEGGILSPPLEELKIINEELDRIARIIRSLLDLYRTPEQKLIPLNINDELSALIKLMEKGFEEHKIRVNLMLSDEVPLILASPDLIRQVLLNILRNAEDAMEEKGGTLTIATEIKTKGDKERQEKKIILSITDTGCGIPPEHLDKVFDPFFSTKKPEKGGTGLGLSVSYSIMRSLGGDIEIKSKVGQGTTVCLELPVAEIIEQNKK